MNTVLLNSQNSKRILNCSSLNAPLRAHLQEESMSGPESFDASEIKFYCEAATLPNKTENSPALRRVAVAPRDLFWVPGGVSEPGRPWLPSRPLVPTRACRNESSKGPGRGQDADRLRRGRPVRGTARPPSGLRVPPAAVAPPTRRTCGSQVGRWARSVPPSVFLPCSRALEHSASRATGSKSPARLPAAAPPARPQPPRAPPPRAAGHRDPQRRAR